MAKKPKLPKLFGDEEKELELMFVDISNLKHTTRNNFDLYEGEKLEDMKRSMASIGVLTPLIVQKDIDGIYEVIAGNNRLNIAKMLQIKELPVRVVKGLNDFEKDIIIFETNIQRSFEEMTFKQRAKAIYHYYNAIKQQGRRNDLIDVSKLREENTTQKNGFKLGGTQMWKYSKFYTLFEPLKDLVDETNKLTFSLAVEMSNLELKMQEHLYTLITEYDFNITEKQVKSLKVHNEKNLSLDDVKALLINDSTTYKCNDGDSNVDNTTKVSGKSIKKSKSKAYTVSKEIIDKYIPKELSDAEKENEVIKAFELYFNK